MSVLSEIVIAIAIMVIASGWFLIAYLSQIGGWKARCKAVIPTLCQALVPWMYTAVVPSICKPVDTTISKQAVSFITEWCKKFLADELPTVHEHSTTTTGAMSAIKVSLTPTVETIYEDPEGWNALLIRTLLKRFWKQLHSAVNAQHSPETRQERTRIADLAWSFIVTKVQLRDLVGLRALRYNILYADWAHFVVTILRKERRKAKRTLYLAPKRVQVSYCASNFYRDIPQHEEAPLPTITVTPDYADESSDTASVTASVTTKSSVGDSFSTAATDIQSTPSELAALTDDANAIGSRLIEPFEAVYSEIDAAFEAFAAHGSVNEDRQPRTDPFDAVYNELDAAFEAFGAHGRVNEDRRARTEPFADVYQEIDTVLEAYGTECCASGVVCERHRINRR